MADDDDRDVDRVRHRFRDVRGVHDRPVLAPMSGPVQPGHSNDPAPSPTPKSEGARPVRFRILWARCDRYPIPQFVGAWNHGLYEAWPEEYERLRDEAKDYFLTFGEITEDAWTFWEATESVPEPTEVLVDA